ADAAPVGHLGARAELLEQRQRLICSGAPFPVWNPRRRVLGRILAADADAEGEAARADLRERRQLAGHDNGVAKREEVDRRLHAQRRMRSEERGGADEAVATGSLEDEVI